MSELERIFDRISTRLNNVLCEMKPGYDDSIVGFNEAWDVMRAVFKDELTKAASRTPDEPQAAREIDRDAIAAIVLKAMQAKVDPDAYGASYAIKINADRAVIAADSILALTRPQSARGE